MLIPVLLLVFTITCVVVERKDGFAAVMNFGFGIIFTLLVIICAGFLGQFLPKTYVAEKDEIQLVALKDQPLISAQLMFGTGKIESKMFLVFFQEKDGKITYGKIPATKVEIIESKDGKAVIKVFKPTFRNRASCLIAIMLDGEPKYEVSVPEDTVIKGYRLDL